MRSLIGNKSSEKDIREWLSTNGYSGKSAQFAEAELHAIMQPGWLQIFRFEAYVLTAEGQQTQLYGAMRSDERNGKPAIRVFDDVKRRDALLGEWSEGLITQRRKKDS